MNGGGWVGEGPVLPPVVGNSIWSDLFGSYVLFFSFLGGFGVVFCIYSADGEHLVVLPSFFIRISRSADYILQGWGDMVSYGKIEVRAFWNSGLRKFCISYALFAFPDKTLH